MGLCRAGSHSLGFSLRQPISRCVQALHACCQSASGQTSGEGAMKANARVQKGNVGFEWAQPLALLAPWKGGYPGKGHRNPVKH